MYLNVKPLCQDHVDHVRAQWQRERPELDTTPVAVIARIGRAARYVDYALDRVFAAHGLTREAFDVLAALRRSGPEYRLSPTDLHRALMRTSGAMTNRLHRLEEAGLVRRVPDPADGRALLVELTPDGRAVVDRAVPDHLANERRLLGSLTPDEQDTLAALLRKLLIGLEQAERQPAAVKRSRRRR